MQSQTQKNLIKIKNECTLYGFFPVARVWLVSVWLILGTDSNRTNTHRVLLVWKLGSKSTIKTI